MRDIPVFTTDHGVASLTLKQIPYTAEAYIRLQDSQEPDKLLDVCCDFCRAAGAVYIYATGAPFLKKFPLHTSILQMCRKRQGLPNTDAIAVPLEPGTLEKWRQIHNMRMKGVPNGASLSAADVEAIMGSQSGYFIYKDTLLQGIGVSEGEQIRSVISVVPGAGRDVLLALNATLTGEYIFMEVASENKRAVRLYESLGFTIETVISEWYHII